MNIVQRIAKNTSAQVLSKGVEIVVGTFFLAFVARIFGPQTYGKYCFAMVFPSMFAVFVMYGLDVLATREIARDRSVAGKYIGCTLSLQALVTPAAFALIVVGVNLGGYPADTKMAVYIFGIASLINTMRIFLDSAYRAFERMEYTASLDIFGRLFTAGVGLGALLLGYRLIGLAFVFLLASVATLMVSCALLNMRFARITFNFDISFWKYLIKEGWPFAAASILAVFYSNIGLVILSKMEGDVAVGLYGSAFKLCTFMIFGAMAFANALFPVFAWSFKRSKSLFISIYRTSLKTVILSIVPIALLITLLAENIIGLVFGSNFAAATSGLRIMVWVVLFAFLYYPLGNVLVCIDKQRQNLLAIFIAFLTSIVFNIILISRFGFFGASVALVICNATLFGFLYYFVSSQLCGLELPTILFKTTTGCIGLSITFHAAKSLNLFLATIMGLIIYTIILYALNPLKAEETDMLKQFLKRGQSLEETCIADTSVDN